MFLRLVLIGDRLVLLCFCNNFLCLQFCVYVCESILVNIIFIIYAGMTSEGSKLSSKTNFSMSQTKSLFTHSHVSALAAN